MEAIVEARRYLDNARGFLSNNAKKEDGLYRDRKYVKIAGHAAYTGVLVALDELLEEKKKKTRKSVEWYQKELSGLDKKITSDFATAYEILHIAMSYDGTRSADIAKLGFEKAEKIIGWVENRLNKNQKWARKVVDRYLQIKKLPKTDIQESIIIHGRSNLPTPQGLQYTYP